MSWLGNLWKSAKSLGKKVWKGAKHLGGKVLSPVLRTVSKVGSKVLDVGDQVLRFGGEYVAPIFGGSAEKAVRAGTELSKRLRKGLGYGEKTADYLDKYLK